MNYRKFQVLTLIIQNEQVGAANKIIKSLNLASSKVLARGTVSSGLLLKLGITSDRRTMLSTHGTSENISEALSRLTKSLRIDKPGNGIAYITNAYIPCDNEQAGGLNQSKDIEEKSMFVKITVVVDRGKAQDVMSLARAKGAKGGTIIHGRGSGEKEIHKIFGIEVEEEKELVFILVPKDLSEAITAELVEKLELNQQNKGILFIEDVVSVVGLVEKAKNRGLL